MKLILGIPVFFGNDGSRPFERSVSEVSVDVGYELTSLKVQKILGESGCHYIQCLP
jgi:hypothetical protein